MVFNIPEKNATIKFGVNGTYSSATLEDSRWVFRGLSLELPQNVDFFDINVSRSIGDLTFSAENSNVTIWAYLMFYYTLPVHSLVYTAEGRGQQTINLGLNSSDVTEWSVIVLDNVFLAEGQGWTFLGNDTLSVTDQIGNVTIAHFKLDSFEKNMVFYLQHSVSILTVIMLTVVVTAAIMVKFRTRKQLKK